MKTIGFWKEYTNVETDPSIFVLKKNCDIPNKEKILNYLNNGIVLLGKREQGKKDLLSNLEIYVTPHSATYTDGDWVWTYGFIQYVERHNTEIDPEFLKHIELNKFIVPKLEEVGEIKLKKARNLVSAHEVFSV